MKRTSYGPQSLKNILPAATKPVFSKRNRIEAQLMTEWADIVGVETAKHSTPLRLTFPRGKSDEATLLLGVLSPFAMQMQHQAPLIIEYIAAYMGYSVVAHIRIKQQPMPKTFQQEDPLVSPAARHIAEPIEGIDDEGLSDALSKYAEGLAKPR